MFSIIRQISSYFAYSSFGTRIDLIDTIHDAEHRQLYRVLVLFDCDLLVLLRLA